MTEPPVPHYETPHALITDLAAHAALRSLCVLLAGSLLVAALVLLHAPALWPFAAFSGSLTTIALWGLLAHLPPGASRRWVRWCQWGLVLLGSALALAGGLAIFYGVLGPRWML